MRSGHVGSFYTVLRNSSITDEHVFFVALHFTTGCNSRSSSVPSYSSSVRSSSGSHAISREAQNALVAAKNYLEIMAFSKEGLFEQLSSEYGNKYPEDAARYAVDNVKADWNEQALKKAQQYLDILPMSTEELRGQLEYEKFTPEEIQYAIERLPQ